MGADAYEILALCMRYVFAALMLLIVLRAWRITAADGARATKLRRLSPQTGIVGELLVVGGGERARDGMRYRLILEGTVGSGRRCDIRIRHSSVRSRHAVFQMTNEGLFIRSHAGARIADGHGRQRREMTLHDGDILFIGHVRLMLVLSEADEAPEELERRHRRIRRAQEEERAEREDVFDIPQSKPKDLFLSNPAGAQRSGDIDADARYDEYDDARYDEYDDADADTRCDEYDNAEADEPDDYDQY